MLTELSPSLTFEGEGPNVAKYLICQNPGRSKDHIYALSHESEPVREFHGRTNRCDPMSPCQTTRSQAYYHYDQDAEMPQTFSCQVTQTKLLTFCPSTMRRGGQDTSPQSTRWMQLALVMIAIPWLSYLQFAWCSSHHSSICSFFSSLCISTVIYRSTISPFDLVRKQGLQSHVSCPVPSIMTTQDSQSIETATTALLYGDNS